MTDPDWTKALEVARRFFDDIRDEFSDHHPLWNGTTVQASSAMNLLHEVAHFQLAPSWRRHRAGYGLGLEPEGGAQEVPQLVRDSRSIAEESLASALGILWGIRLGLDWVPTAKEHGWLNHHPEGSEVAFRVESALAVRKLIHVGVLDSDLSPRTSLANPWRHGRFEEFEVNNPGVAP